MLRSSISCCGVFHAQIKHFSTQPLSSMSSSSNLAFEKMSTAPQHIVLRAVATDVPPAIAFVLDIIKEQGTQ